MCKICRWSAAKRRVQIHIKQHIVQMYCPCGYNKVSRDAVYDHQASHQAEGHTGHGPRAGYIFQVDLASYHYWSTKVMGWTNPPSFPDPHPTLRGDDDKPPKGVFTARMARRRQKREERQGKRESKRRPSVPEVRRVQAPTGPKAQTSKPPSTSPEPPTTRTRSTVASRLTRRSTSGTRNPSGVPLNSEETVQAPRCRDIRYYPQDDSTDPRSSRSRSTRRRVVAPILPANPTEDNRDQEPISLQVRIPEVTTEAEPGVIVYSGEPSQPGERPGASNSGREPHNEETAGAVNSANIEDSPTTGTAGVANSAIPTNTVAEIVLPTETRHLVAPRKPTIPPKLDPQLLMKSWSGREKTPLWEIEIY